MSNLVGSYEQYRGVLRAICGGPKSNLGVL